MQNVGGTLMEAHKARNQELEWEVVRRTAELKESLDDLKATQAQVVQQEKMVSLGALPAGIAHEIKNPLNFINNFAALSRELADELEEERATGRKVQASSTPSSSITEVGVINHRSFFNRATLSYHL